MNKCPDRYEITYKIKYKPLSLRQPLQNGMFVRNVLESSNSLRL